MEKWLVSMKKADFESIGKKFNISPVTARVIRNREVVEEEDIRRFLYGSMNDLADPLLMKDMDKAVALLEQKLKEHKKIRIIGDYDIDGVNATYILLKGLRDCGAVVDTDIPDRKKDGYGINEQLIERAAGDGIDTIITCDNGIAAREQIAYGKELGLTIIVTDHHDVPYRELEDGSREYLLPPADAVIDPKREDCAYPFKLLCGAAVAYRFLEALYVRLGIEKRKLAPLIENAAVATVGDVVDLEGENRIIVKTGLEMLKDPINEGLRALIEQNGIDRDNLSAFHIGFVIGPCINASGRLDSAARALRLLDSDKAEAARLAGDLKALNDSRKGMTQEGVMEAERLMEEGTLQHDKVLVVYLPDCHESLAGIIAGRIREKYYKPVFVVTKSEEGLKGSGRSIEGYHMYDELCKVSHLLSKFGGHPMAAGFSLPEENLKDFRRELNKNETLTEDDLTEKIHIDVPMPIDYITEELVEELKLLAPFGKGNPKPLFAEKGLKLLGGRILGKNKNVLKLTVKNSKGTVMEAMYFGDVERFLKDFTDRYGEAARLRLLSGGDCPGVLSAVYYPSINEYMGRKTLQIQIQNYNFTGRSSYHELSE